MKNYPLTNTEDLRLLSETALESSLAGFWDWNMVTNEEYLSPRFKEMFGYEDHEMTNTPESWQKIAFPEDLPSMFQNFETHIKSKGKTPFNSIVRYTHRNGKTIWVKCTGKVVEWSDSGEPLRAIGCHVDITEEKERELALQKTLREREVLLKEVHHRVKNNLQLLMSLSRLKEVDGNICVKELEDSIHSIANAYQAIYKARGIDNILIHEYLSQIIKSIIKGHDIKFEINELDLVENIDNLIPLGLIVTELTNNSIKHAFTNSNNNTNKKIKLSIWREGQKTKILYEDNGAGFNEKVLNSIDNIESFGLEMMHSLSEQIGAKFNYYNNQGACVELILGD